MLVGILVPIFICVVLPVTLVWIVFYSIRQKNNNETTIILESIRNNPNIDPDYLIKSFKKSRMTPMQHLSRKLLSGSIFTLVGLAFACFAIFRVDEDLISESWMMTGIMLAIGIGFLITCWFEYKNLGRIEKEFSSEEIDNNFIKNETH